MNAEKIKDHFISLLAVNNDTPVLVEKMHECLDKNNSGYIEFEKFKKFLFYEL